MSNKRWEPNDKIQLMKLYSTGYSYEEIGKSLERSPLAIKLRLESIVYDNLVKGKSIDILTRMLNTNNDTIKQLYYSHKSFKEGRGEEVKNVDFPSDNLIPPKKSNSVNKQNDNNKDNGGHHSGGSVGSSASSESNSIKSKKNDKNDSNNNNDDNDDNNQKHHIKTNNNNKKKSRSTSISRSISRSRSTPLSENDTNITNPINKNIAHIEQENHILEQILNNYRMHRQIRKLYVDGKLSKSNRDIYEKMINKDT